jgi:hypothetical protein
MAGANAFSTELSRALGDIRPHTRAERAGGCSATGTNWSLPSLRTDSVNRGFCISLLTLAIVVLAGLIIFFPFFIIPKYLHGLRAESVPNSSQLHGGNHLGASDG